MTRAFTIALLLASSSLGATAQITAEDAPWLRAARGAFEEAQRLDVPFDIQIVADPDPLGSPVAMAFAEGRCTLRLQHRGSRRADLRMSAPAHYEAAIAHEFGHCLLYRVGRPQSEDVADAFSHSWIAGRHPEWAQEVGRWFGGLRGKPVLPALTIPYRRDLLGLVVELSRAHDAY